MKIVPGAYRMRNGRQAIVHWIAPGTTQRSAHGSQINAAGIWRTADWFPDGLATAFPGEITDDDLIAPWTEPRKLLAWRCKKPIYEEGALNTPRNYRAYQGTVEWWDTLITGDDEFWERIEQLDVEIK